VSELLLVAATERELVMVDHVTPLCCGIGPVEATLNTSVALQDARYVAVLHVGIAGAVTLEPGKLVIGSEAIYCDVIDPNATLPRVHRTSASPALVDAARAVIPDASVVPIATSARVGGGIACEVEAMEGFGVLRAAELAGVPAIEVRVISNSVHDADRGRWKITDALAILSETVPRLVPALLNACRA
jgi:futalosine hydrolase